MKRTAIPGLAGVFLLALSPAFAQKKAISREVNFAKGLATEFGFVGLGNQVLEDLLKRKDLEPEDIDRINLAKCELLLLAARATPKVEQKLDFYDQSTRKIEEVLTRFKGKDIAIQARLLFAQAALSYGQVIGTLMEDEADPEKKEELRLKAEKIYRGAIKACNDAMAALEPSKDTDSEAKINYSIAWMYLGELQKNWATSAKTETERKIRLETAKKTLEDFIYEYGEDTPAGARALILYAQCSEMEGNLEDARDDFAGTKDTIWETLTSKDNPPDPRLIPLLVRVMEEAYYNQIRLLNKEGKTEEAIRAGEEMTARVSQLRDIQPSKPYGLRAMIEYARALLASGEDAKIKKSLVVTKDVADKAGTSYIRTEAQKLINEIIRTQARDVAVFDPDTLFQASEGSYRSGKYFEALQGAKKTLRALKTPEQKKDFGLKVYKLMGRVLTDLSRYAEASYAYGAGCELFGKLSPGDPNYKKTVVDLAIRCKQVARIFRAKLPKASKAMAEPLVNYADGIVTVYAPGAAAYINLTAAKDLLEKKKFDLALGKIALVKQTSDYYEEALVLKAKVHMEKAKALAEKKDYAPARREYATAKRILEDYLQRFIPAHPNPQGQAAGIRANSEPLAWYYLGLLAFYQADGQNGYKADPAKWKDVLAIFRRFPRDYAYNKGFVELGWYYVGRAQTALGDLKKAQESYKNLKAVKKTSNFVPNLALYIFGAHLDKVRVLEKKVPPPKETLRAAYKEAITFADEYISGNPLPQYQVLFPTFNFAIALGDQEKALKLFELIEKFYGKNPKYTSKILKFVKPRVVEILQKNGDFNRAKPLVEQLLAAYKKGRWPLPILWLGVFEYGGWLDVDGVRVKEVIGLNQPLKALEPPLELMPTLYRTVQAPESKFSLQWYAVVAQYTYLAYRAGLKDSKWFQEARRYLRVAESIDNFAGVKKAPYLLKGKEKREFNKLTAAEKRKRVQQHEKQRQDLYRIFQYLKSKLGG